MLLCGSSIGFAQLMEVGSTQKVNLPEGVKVDMATISPNGDYLLVADQQKQGLQKLDLATGQLTTVTTASGSEYDAKILDNGNTIVYRETQIGKDPYNPITIHHSHFGANTGTDHRRRHTRTQRRGSKRRRSLRGKRTQAKDKSYGQRQSRQENPGGIH